MGFRLTLKTKLLLGYGVPAVLYFAIAGLVYSTATKTLESFKEVKRVQEVLISTNTMERAGQGMIRNARGYLLNRSEEFNTEYQQQLTLAREAGESIKNSITHPEQKERLRKMLELVEDYDRASSPMIKLAKEGKQTEAIALFNSGSGTQFVRDFDRITNEFENFQRDLLEKETKASQQALEFLIAAIVISSFFLIILSVSIALFLSSGISNTIERAVTAIATSSTEIAATVSEQERTAAQQASSVNQTTATMDELGASSRHAAEQAESSAENARQLLKLAESSSQGAHQVLNLAEGGSKTVGQTMQGMQGLKEKVEAIAEHITRLNQQANQIGNITGLVTNLANQTNMLALNASVEAVRAGEHGKGFGVVAAEIRKLADQSKQSAEKITTLVDDIQNGINVTVQVSHEGLKKAEEGIQLSQGTAEAFAKVTQAIDQIVLTNQQASLAAINKVVESCQQISLTAKQQAIAIQQVVEAMNAINQGANETSTGISQTKIGTQKLNEAATELKEVV